jgi:thiosulfate reductase/polysulfide reductase chain A
LNALLGSWGRKGGFYTPVSMDIPGYPYPPYPKSEKGKVDNPGGKYPFALETLTTGIREATITGQPYPVKGWFTYATNLITALPNEAETIKAIQSLDLMVVVDVIPTEMAGWADVVLPESTYLERYDDLNPELFRVPFVGLRQPVVPSPHDQKPNWWIARELAKKLGLESYYPWKTIEEYLDFRLTKAGLSFGELKQKGIIHGQSQPIFYEEGVEPTFPTVSGKIDFYSTALRDKGLDPVPKYTKPVDPPPGMFRLLFGRAPVHSFGRTQSNPVLNEMMDENEVWLNADVAARMGLTDGRYVRLKNQDGMVSNRVRLKATQRIRPDCVYMVHGFGHTAVRLRRTVGKGASDAQLVTQFKTDPLMGGTGMNVNFVAVEAEA